jgi:hypothetical protein
MALLFGVHENVDPAATVARVGGNATRVFTAGVIGPKDLVKEVSAKCGPTWAAGQTAVWSFKPLPEAVRSGAWRKQVEALGQFLRDNPAKRTVVVIWHEPENDVPKWFANAGEFVALFDTVAGWLRGKHPSVVVAHAALAYRYGDGIDITDRTAPSWRTSADVHCIDIYSGRSHNLDTILPDLPAYRRWREFVARDSRWGVTERGWSIGKMGKGGSSATRVAAMSREATWLQSLPQEQQPEIYLLWNTGGTENDDGLVFDAGAEQVARTINLSYAARAVARIAAGAAAAAAATGAATGAAGAVAGPAAQTRQVTCPLCAGSGAYEFSV